jgi:hypothetical protein
LKKARGQRQLYSRLSVADGASFSSDIEMKKAG